MTKLNLRSLSSIICLFIIVYFARLFISPSLLPKDYGLDDTFIYEITLLDTPTQVGSKLHYLVGHTTIEWKQYHSLSLGSRYRISGSILPTIQLGNITGLTLKVDNTTLISDSPSLNCGEKILINLAQLRNYLTSKLAQNLPEPESSLAAGILLGVKRDLPYDFRTSLIKSGTLHTVAASGYNVNIVARYILAIATHLFPHSLALIMASFGIIFFCLLSGSSAAVLRAGIMGFLMLLGTGLGRQKDAKRLFIIASYSMLIFDPLYLFDVGWQLSVAATAGILYLEPLFSTKINFPANLQTFSNLLKEFWWPTIAATVATTPISLLTFNQFSWVGPLTNLLILPTIPPIMSLTAIFLVIPITPMAAILYLPLTYFVRVVNFLGNL